jgi:hypothetical protein
MKSDAQVISGPKVTKVASDRRIRRDVTFGGLSPVARVIADPGKIRLGGAWRLPSSHKAV